jgi:TonB family protein
MSCSFACRAALAVSASLWILPPPTELLAQQFDPRERYEAPAIVRLSQPTIRNLMKNPVLPNYPKDAKKDRVQGTVAVFLSLDKKGQVSKVGVLGHPLLASAAIEAINKTHFQPYTQNGEGVPSEAQIDYVFKCLPDGRTNVSIAP